jgi:fumarate reductase subunit D
VAFLICRLFRQSALSRLHCYRHVRKENNDVSFIKKKFVIQFIIFEFLSNINFVKFKLKKLRVSNIFLMCYVISVLVTFLSEN